MSKHSCFECKWCHYLLDSSNRNVEICVFDQSENYLQEVLLGSDDCELDGYAEVTHWMPLPPLPKGE